VATDLELKAGVLTQKRKELAEIFEKNKTPEGGYNLTPEQVEDVRSRNNELTDLGKAWETARDLEEVESKNRAGLADLDRPRHPSAHSNGGQPTGAFEPQAPQAKSLAELLGETAEFKAAYANLKAGGMFKPFSADIPGWDTKTVMAETGTGFTPPNYRTNIVVLSAQRKPVVADLIPQDPTDKEAIKYMLETTFNENSAGMVSEGSSATEVALGYTEQTVLVQWLPVTLPVTEQQLEDVPQLNGVINNRLTLMIGQVEENELLNGTGSSPRLQGFLTVSGIQTQALGSDPAPDAIMKAMTLVRYTGFAQPTGMVVHPNNWQTIRLLKTTTGQYLWGNPSEQGPERVWGMPAIVTPVITSGTALLGDFLMFSHISRRMGLRIEVGYVNDDFKKGQKTLRAMERLSLEIYRPAAFCTVTGLQ
jgi:HK97 family phage major capsid protein